MVVGVTIEGCIQCVCYLEIGEKDTSFLGWGAFSLNESRSGNTQEACAFWGE